MLVLLLPWRRAHVQTGAPDSHGQAIAARNLGSLQIPLQSRRDAGASPFGLYFHSNVCEDVVDRGLERLASRGPVAVMLFQSDLAFIEEVAPKVATGGWYHDMSSVNVLRAIPH